MGQMPKHTAKYKKYFLHYLSCLAIVLILTLTTLNINKFINNKKVLGAATDNQKILDEKTYWLEVVKNNPTYLGGYLELAKVDVELNMKDEAKDYIEKAYLLQPNSTKIPEVQNLLGL
jgi:hypothetical protein